MERPLGRMVPNDMDHVARYPIRLTASSDLVVNRALDLPYRLKLWYDQLEEGACVGHGSSWAKSIIESMGGRRTHKFNPWWLWDRAKEIDEWDDTNPGDSNGTSVRAAFDVLRTRGHALNDGDWPDRRYAVEENRWATRVDEMRACIAAGMPVVIGVNWYENFDKPVLDGKQSWIGRGDLGRIRGGHCVCIYGASDRKQAFKFVNNWGPEYPLCWLPYGTMQRLLDEYGEATIITDTLMPELSESVRVGIAREVGPRAATLNSIYAQTLA